MKNWKAQFARMEKLIGEGIVQFNYYGFTVEVDGVNHEVLDLHEQPDDFAKWIILSPPPTVDEIRRGQVNERWLQEYIQRHPQDFALSHVRRQRLGPDFRARYRNKVIHVEIEICWRNWFQHKHHQAEAFADVAMLILLDHRTEPPPQRRAQLPTVIQYIGVDHFIGWIQAYHATPEHGRDRDLARYRFLANILEDCYIKDAQEAEFEPTNLRLLREKSWFGYSLGLRGFDHKLDEHRREFLQAAREMLPRNPQTGCSNLLDFDPKKLPRIFHKPVRNARHSDRYVRGIRNDDSVRSQ